MLTLNPYLVFKDTCEEAFNFYKQVFNGEILFMGRYKDVPQPDKHFFPQSTDELIMHATLQISPDITLMGCDSLEAHHQAEGVPIKNFYLYVSTGNREEAYRLYNELAEGGQATMPIAKTFWSTDYGMLTDKFGIHWKITYHPEENGESTLVGNINQTT